MRTVGFLASIFLLTVSGAWAVEIPVGSNLVLEMGEIGSRWRIYQAPPDFLLSETSEHLRHEAVAQGKEPSVAQIHQAAEKRLSANEAFVCNPASRACLIIDFSPLRAEEKAPGGRAVALSARYAAEGLAEEEGVNGLEQHTAPTAIPGARHVSRIDASFSQHGESRQFIGYVGFADPSWFYLYYTDPLHDPADRMEMEKIFRVLAIRSQEAR